MFATFSDSVIETQVKQDQITLKRYFQEVHTLQSKDPASLTEIDKRRLAQLGQNIDKIQRRLQEAEAELQRRTEQEEFFDPDVDVDMDAPGAAGGPARGAGDPNPARVEQLEQAMEAMRVQNQQMQQQLANIMQQQQPQQPAQPQPQGQPNPFLEAPPGLPGAQPAAVAPVQAPVYNDNLKVGDFAVRAFEPDTKNSAKTLYLVNVHLNAFQDQARANNLNPDRYGAMYLGVAGTELKDIVTQSTETLQQDETHWNFVRRVIIQHYSSFVNLQLYRLSFQNIKQNVGETLDAFKRRLDTTSLYCGFDDQERQSHVNLVFFNGMRDTEKAKYHVSKNHSIQKTIEMNATKEAANALFDNQSSFGKSDPEYNLAINKAFKSSRGRPYGNRRSRGYNRPQNSGGSTQGSRCMKCGRDKHSQIQDCPALYDVCYTCNEKGHFAFACPQKMRGGQRGYRRGYRGQRGRGGHQLRHRTGEADHEQEADEEERDCEEYEEEATAEADTEDLSHNSVFQAQSVGF